MQKNDHDYIVAEYAIQQCQWIDDKHQCQKSSTTTIQQSRQNKWRGYAILESSDVIETPLFEQNPIIDSSRSRRGSTTTPDAAKV